MKTKEFRMEQVRTIASELTSKWDETKRELSVDGRTLYSIVAVKRKIEAEAAIIEEAILAAVQQYDGKVNEQGFLEIPEDKRAAANLKLAELATSKIKIEFNPIKFDASTYLPVSIVELLFDFIEFVDEEATEDK